MFRANMSNCCDVVEATASQQHKDGHQLMGQGFDRAWSLSEFFSNRNHSVGGSAGTTHDDGSSGAPAHLRPRAKIFVDS